MQQTLFCLTNSVKHFYQNLLARFYRPSSIDYLRSVIAGQQAETEGSCTQCGGTLAEYNDGDICGKCWDAWEARSFNPPE